MTTSLRMVAMLFLLPALAPSWCRCESSATRCGCCGNSAPPVSRPSCNCTDGCACGRSIPTSQAVAKGRIQLRSQPTTEASLRIPYLRSSMAHSRRTSLSVPPIAVDGAERCIALCRLNR
jgi:hypothetical protein